MKIEVFQRTDFSWFATLKDDSGNLLNLAGASVLFLVKDREAFIEKTIGDGITVVDEEAGEIRIDFSSDDLNHRISKNRFELLIVDIENKRYISDQGSFVINESLGVNKDL